MLADIVRFATDGPWSYVVLGALAAVDALVPMVPSETAVIAAGVLAATGEIRLGLVLLCAMLGAIAGDNAAYAIGRVVGPPIRRRAVTRWQGIPLAWAERRLFGRGAYLIIVGRFIPGGRTAVTLAAGVLRMGWARFLAFDVVAAAIWASYAALIGFFGGSTFTEHPVVAFGAALAIAFLATVAIEGGRWSWARRPRAIALRCPRHVNVSAMR